MGGTAEGIQAALADEDQEGAEDSDYPGLDDLAGAAFDRAWLDSVLHGPPSTNGV